MGVVTSAVSPLDLPMSALAISHRTVLREAVIAALHAAKQVVRAENKGQGRAVTIMGDRDIPYALLRKVMATAARADYSDVSFAVTKKEGKA